MRARRRRIPTSASSQPRPSGCGSPHYPSRALACAPRATVWRFAEAPDAGALAVARSPRKRPALPKQKSNWVRMVALRTSRTCSTRRSPDCCFRASNAVAIGRCAAREEVRSLAHHSARCRSHLASQRSRSRPRTDRRFPERSRAGLRGARVRTRETAAQATLQKRSARQRAAEDARVNYSVGGRG